MRKKRLAMPFLCIGGMLLSIANLHTQNTTSAIEISYPLIENVQGGSIKVTNSATKKSQSFSPPYILTSLEPGEYILEEESAPDGCLPNVNPSRTLVLEKGKNELVKYYNVLIPQQEIPLYYENRTTGKVFLVGADYLGVKIGEYYWMNSNFNHVEPSWTWWSTPIGISTNYPVGQKQLNKYLEQVRLDKNYFQVDTTLFHKYYGRYYDSFTRNYMNNYAKMYEGEGKSKDSVSWKMGYVKDFRQLFAMSPFSSDNKKKALGETDVRFALSAKEGDNPMTNYAIPGDCGTTYWFDSRYVTNMYGFNMMPGGSRYNEVAEGEYYSWSTNLCGDEVAFQAYTGDLYHLFYTSKFVARDGHAGLHDLVETGYNTSYHWYNVRWCRRLSDSELGYKLYIKASESIMNSQEWATFVEKGADVRNDESGLLRRVKDGDFDPESFDIVITEYSPNGDVPAPTGYEELPNGYIRGFYTQYILSDRHMPSTDKLKSTKGSFYTCKDILLMACNVQDSALGAVYKPTGVEEESASSSNVDLLKAYPNPVKDYLTIEGVEAGIVTLYSLDGSLVGTSNLEDGKVFLGFLSEGVYILTLETPERVYKKHIIKE